MLRRGPNLDGFVFRSGGQFTSIRRKINTSDSRRVGLKVRASAFHVIDPQPDVFVS